MAMQVAGKTAIVTGAGSGINYCFAKLLLENGCNVVIADLSLRPEAKDLVSKYSSKSSPQTARAIFQQTDVTDWSQLDRIFEVAQEEFNGADIVCPGAGVYEPPFSNFWYPPGQPPSRDDVASSRYTLLDINLTHPIRTTQLAISHFLSQKKPGVITHISSIAAQNPSFPCPVYVATKHAISGFVRSLAEMENPPAPLPKIRVNGVAPGVIKTPLWTDHPEKLKMFNPEVDDWATPEEVAKAMLDLVQKPEFVGGTILEVGKDQRRKVEPFNDPGPKGSGNTVSNSEKEKEEIWKRLKARL